MTVAIKSFEALSLEELYDVLQLRVAVFIIEQRCFYQDIDGNDAMALHAIGKNDGEVVAYARIFPPGAQGALATIGRVLVKGSHRNGGLGQVIMKASMAYIEQKFDTGTMELSAQEYLRRFYEELGFTAVGEGYLEDGIPHIRMVRN